MQCELNDELHDAVTYGDVEGMERLVAAGADPSALVRDWTPLHRSASNGDVRVVAVLLRMGACVNVANSTGGTPLMMAAFPDFPLAMEALLAAGAHVDHTTMSGNTALHWASRMGRVGAVQVLLAAGARVDARDKAGNLPIDVVSALLARLSRLAAAPLDAPHVQVADDTPDKTNETALRELLAAAAPWSRRGHVAAACYGGVWQWEE
jgi:ankyrin repeat protein